MNPRSTSLRTATATAWPKLKRAARGLLAFGLALSAAQAFAQVTFYEHEGFQGRSFTTDRPVEDFGRLGFNDRASSVVVRSERWEVCEDVRFGGRCVVLRRGDYPSLGAMGLNDRVSSVRDVGRGARVDDDRYAPGPVAPQLTLYEHEGFGGRAITLDGPQPNLIRRGFNDIASAAVVIGAPWEVCRDAGFAGPCVVLRPGRYPELGAVGINDGISSLRPLAVDARIDDRRRPPPPPPPMPVYDSRPRGGERLFEAPVNWSRAVVGNGGQRCWIEREQISQGGAPNVPAAVAGAVIGGILGHQIGGGSGRDIATAGGAVGGAVIGSNIGRGNETLSTRDVQRCASVPNARPDYWDVSYTFRGVEHRVQLSAPPGPSVTVNERGEPRG